MSAAPGLPKRPLRRFHEVENGKEPPENVVISRFYTAWARSGHCFAELKFNFEYLSNE
jgi:hypothetical protein